MAKVFVGDLSYEVTDGARERATRAATRTLRSGAAAPRRAARAALCRALRPVVVRTPRGADRCLVATRAETLGRRYAEFGEVREVRSRRRAASASASGARRSTPVGWRRLLPAAARRRCRWLRA
jgi:hypothetical protein